jgi:glycosyltransferase involved in cell wall biosynthesis
VAPGQPAGTRRVGGIDLVTVDSVDLSRLAGGQLALGRGLRRRVRAAQRSEPHVLHANGLYFHTSVAAARLARRSRVPLVTTVHVAGTERLTGTIGTLTAVWEATVGRYILKSSARVVAVSHAVADRSLELGVSSDRLVVAPNGVDTALFRPPPVRTARPVPTIAFVGRLVANKGPTDLLEALGTLHRDGIAYRATFVGDGPQRGELERRAEQLGLTAAVEFRGHVADVSTLLRDTDVAVRPSTTEGMSLSVLEAMASGCCTVVSDIPANTELVRDGVNGLTFATGDPGALAGVLRLALADEQLRQRLGGAARFTADAHSWDASARGLAHQLVAVSRREVRR